jgi:hypothetical protein
MRAVEPVCPRCGYDLRGQVDVWHGKADAEGAGCPLTGTCSECGLIVEWRLVMRPELIALRWFVETERPPRTRWSAWRTAWRAMAPWVFWRSVRMETAFDGRRVVWWAAMVAMTIVSMVTLYVLGWGVGGAIKDAYFFNLAATLDWGGWAQWLWRYIDEVLGYVVPAMIAALSPVGGVAWVPAMICGLVVPPTMFMALPFTRAASKVRGRHIVRAAVYAGAPILAIAMSGIAMGVLDHWINHWVLTPSIHRLHPFELYDYAPGPPRQTLWLAVMAWQVVWWGCAFKIGFRMSDWRQALAAVMVPTVIVQMVMMHINVDFDVWAWW